MLVDCSVVLQPFHNFFFLLGKGPLLSSLLLGMHRGLPEVADIFPSLLELPSGGAGDGRFTGACAGGVGAGA